ncbi:MAG: hypothetical protein LBT75_02855 [Bacilli bacterium]|jgi:cbb3-type cytochrome oxidase subunit 3|nr:hypothetical protein [Bacilli bacterium]
MKILFIGIAFIIIIFIAAMIYALNKKNNDEITKEVFSPLVDDKITEQHWIVYKLEKTTKLQNFIINIITYDNSTTLSENLYQGLSDKEIISCYPHGDQIWQYDDPYGIKDFIIDDEISEHGLAIKALDDNGYQIIGYINHADAQYIVANKERIIQKRLMYRGGYYKQYLNNKVIDDFENYILKLAIGYQKRND